MKVEVHLLGGLRKIIDIDPYATRGAVVGKNLFFDDGTIVTRADFGGGSAPDDGTAITSWELIINIPPNVVALAEATGTGMFAVTGDSTGAMRTLADSATIEWANGDGVAGNPVASLKPLPDTGIGAALVKLTRDGYGRVEGTEAATTDDLPEGVENLYFTLARVYAGFNLDPDAEPYTPASLDDLEGTLYFSFTNATPGAPPIGGTYDAIGFQIGNDSQRTQIVCAGRIIRTRTDDGPGWSGWYSLPMVSVGTSGSEILVTGEVGPVALTTNDETDWLYT